MCSQNTLATAASQPHPPAFMIPFMKLPTLLYRLGLGWMFGQRFMLLTHVGRRSGKTYHTVLAVLRIDENTKEIFAVSPWIKSNWYHNIQAAPALEVETGTGKIGSGRFGSIRYAPAQRDLSPEEIASLFMEFRSRHPIFSRMVARIPGWKINSSYEEFLELARTLRGVAFHPKQGKK